MFAHQIGDILNIDIHRGPERVISRDAGSFGAIYELLPIGPERNKSTVVKSIRKDCTLSEELMAEFRREIEIWTELPEHPFVLGAMNVHSLSGIPYVRTPYIKGEPEGENLSKIISCYIARKQFINLPNIFSAITQLISALLFLTSEVEGFVHGDIKPSNVLIKSSWVMKLADFGLTKTASLALNT